MQAGDENNSETANDGADTEAQQYDGPSKSARKREMLQLQELGAALVDFPPAKLESLPLSDALADALALARAAKKHGARRRLLQYIGKIMRGEDAATIAAISEFLERSEAAKFAERQRLHDLENWRERILQADQCGAAAIDELLAMYPGADRQWLRQVQRQHQQQLAKGQPPAAARKLFAYLQELSEA
ncbi:MAG: ribosome biogenesis factor YjgA [Pseudomonadales bacterium]